MPVTRPRERAGVREVVDAVAFVLAGLAVAWLAVLVPVTGAGPGWRLVLLLAFWVLVAYLLLPRLHRVLTYVYVPDYFIGRTRTSDGLLGDPVNLALRGTEDQLRAALEGAGWVQADEVTLASGARIVRAVLGRRSYPEAPVSPLHLFGRVQDLAFQQEVDGRPTKRHHVRFWRCPEGWRLPGGYAVDWLAAGTYDRAIGLSLWTFQVTHRIERETDLERDHVVASLTGSVPGIAVHRIEHFSSGYHSRNGGGDRIVTDGTLPVLDLSALPAAPPERGPHVPSLLRAPAPTLFGGAVALLRGLTALASTVATALGADSLVDAGASTLTVAITVAVFAVTGLVDVGLAVAVVRGRDWARLLLLADSTLLIGDALVNDLAGGPRPTLGNGLPAVTLSILVMLALSSGRARAYPRERAAERAAGA
ncbi:LssY C-terminal domain-containing protein [Nocardioides korecus]